MDRTVKEVKENPVVYISVIAVVVLVLLFGIFFTIIGTQQPFSALVTPEPRPDQTSSPSPLPSSSSSEEPSPSPVVSVSVLASPTISPSAPAPANETESEPSKFLVIHTTDIHGWVGGHPHQESYNADLGDFASLMEHLLSRTDCNVLLFDSGDLVEGTGYSDVTEIHGQDLFPIYQSIPGYTALTMGNHDIGRESTVELMESEFIPYFNSENESSGSRGQYLTSNSHRVSENGDDEFIGKAYSIHDVPTGEKILLLGFLYNFPYGANNTSVHQVADTLEESWFQNAMSKEFDFVVVTAHIDPEDDSASVDQITGAIFQSHPEAQIIFLAGHRHRRYYQARDNNQTHIVESGKYFEHIGVLEFDFSEGTIQNFAHSWVETSLENFYELANTTAESFMTAQGQETKQMIDDVRTRYGLDIVLGCSDLHYRTQSAFMDEDSLYRLYLDSVIPQVVTNQSMNVPFAMCNPSTLRYDLYAGNITLNDVFAVNPFKDVYYYFTLNGTELSAFIDSMYSSSSVSKILYRRSIEAGQAVLSRRLYYSTTEVDPGVIYDLICAEYDAGGVEEVLASLFEDRPDLKKQLYPTPENSTTAWGLYVRDMTCESTN